jgi:hypothetical protein
MSDPIFSADTLRLVIDGEKQEQAGAIDRSAALAVRTSPDEFARYNTLAKQTGMDPFGMLENKEAANEAQRRVKWNGFTGIADNPHTARFLADPVNAALAQDDLDNLGQIERSFGGTLKDAWMSVAKGGIGLPQSIVGLADIPLGLIGAGSATKALAEHGLNFSKMQQELSENYSPAQRQANRAVSGADGFFDTLSAALQNPSVIATTVVESLPQMIGGMGVARGLMGVGAKAVGAGMTGPALPGILARTVGTASAPVVAGAAGEGVIGAGSAAAQMQDGVQEFGAKQSVSALISGLGTAVFSLIGGKMAQRLGIDDIDTALARGGFDRAATEAVKKGFVRRLAEGGISEGLLEELPQSAQEQLWQNVATGQPLLNGVGNAAALGLLAGAVTGGAFSALLGGNAQQEEAAPLADAMRLIAASKLKTRDSETLQSFVQSLADANNGDQPATLFISPVAFEEALQQSGLSMDALPSAYVQYAEAKQNGGEMEISAGELLTAFAGTSAEQAIVQHVRTNPDAPTLAEVQADAGKAGEFFRAEAERIVSESDRSSEWNGSAQEVEDFVSRQLEATGMRADEAKSNAQLHRAFATVMADKFSRSGQPLLPKQFFDQHALRVIGQQEIGGSVLEQRNAQTETPPDPRDLILQHNLTADNLLHAIKMGGIAVPSLAITNKSHPLTGFGEVTLLGSKEMADPKGYSGIKVFGADIYSPRYPDIEYKIDANGQKALTKKLDPYSDLTGERYFDLDSVQKEGARALESDARVMAAFLDSKGIKTETVRNTIKELPEALKPFADDTRFTHELAADPAFVEAAYQAHEDMLVKVNGEDYRADAKNEVVEMRKTAAKRGISYTVNGYAREIEAYQRAKRESGTVDRASTKNAMRTSIEQNDLSRDLESYARDLLESLNPTERIFRGFSDSGNRKYIPHTLENVVKILKKDLRGGENFNYGVGSLRAKFTPQFKSIEQIRKAKDRLMDKAAFERVKDEIDNDLYQLAEQFDLSMEQTIEVMEYTPKEGLQKALDFFQKGDKATPEARQQVGEFLTRLKNLPTEYFEALILRDVDLAEFSGAVVPEGVNPKVIEALESRGIKDIRTYKKGDDADRAAKINEFEHLFFQENGDAPRATFNPETAYAISDASGKVIGYASGDSAEAAIAEFNRANNTDVGKSAQHVALISLLAGANASSFLHESGHFFLSVYADIASRDNAPEQIKQDMAGLLEWFGLTGTPQMSPLEQWLTMSLDEQRPYHEQFAETWEQYLFTGKAPSLELQPLFRKFAAWMKAVYQSVQRFVGINQRARLDPTVSAIFDRMLAVDEEIEAAQAARNYVALFKTAEEGGMSPEEWANYQATNAEATEQAAEELTARALRELKWSRTLHGRIVSELQKEAKAARAVAMMDARKEVMTQPLYRVWRFLTAKQPKQGGVKPPKLDSSIVRTESDSLFAAIGRLGGIDKQQLVGQWGIDPKDKPASGVFGKPVVRVNDGLGIDAMAEQLAQYGYLPLDEHGKWDLADFEELFDKELRGDLQFSNQFDYDALEEPRREIDAEDAGRLSEPYLATIYGKEGVWTLLRDLKMTTTDESGWHPDIVAEAFGFESGDTMIRELAIAPTPKEAIEAATDRLMQERYAELATQEAIDSAADEAIHNEVRAKMVATELLHLRKDVGNLPLLLKAAKEYAAELIGRKQIKDLKPHIFAAAEARASKAAEKALAKGDREQAAKDKRAQVINGAAVKETHAALKEIKAGLDFFKRVMKGSTEKVSKTRDPDVVMAARALLADYGIGAKQKKKAANYLEAVKEYDPAMHAMLADRLAGAQANAKDYRQMSVEEFRALKEEIDALWYLARRSKVMEVDGDLMDIQDAEADLMERLGEIGIPKRIPGEGYAVTEAEKKSLSYQSAGAFLRRVESWAGAMDGKAMGPFRRLVWSQVRDAADRYRAARVEKLAQFRTLVDAVAPTLLPVEIAAPEIGYTFGKGKGGMGMVELLHALLHTGNDSNKRKLLLGRNWATLNDDGSIDAQKWDSFVSRMIKEGRITQAHYDFAQGVWDLLESMKPLAQKVHRDVFGRYFDEVTANQLDTPFGTYRGGYVPAIADPDITSDAKTRALAEAENSSLAFAFPSTPKGSTKSRTEYNRPLLLDLRTLTQHIDKVLLFSHLEQPVRDVRKLLTRSEVSTALHRLAPAAFDSMLTPWLNRTAQQVVETTIVGSGGWMRVFAKLRARAGMVAMFGNVANAVQQVTGLSLAAIKVPPKYLMDATAQYLRHPAKMAEMVAELSPYMAGRMANEISMLNDEINAVLLNPTALESAQAWSQRHAYFLQSGVDNVVSPIVWLGAYNHALETADQGISDDALKLQARRLADAAVRETQGSMMPEDVSRLETGNSFVRLFTQFAGYFNMNANLLGSEFVKLARDTGLKNGAGRGLYVLLFGLLIPAWVGEAIMQGFRSGPDDDDKDGEYLDDWMASIFGFGLLRYTTAMVPGVGQTINMIANRFNHKPYDDRMSTAPAISMIESAVESPFAVYEAIVNDGKPSKAIRDVATLVGLALGIPLTPLSKAAGYAADVADEKVDPQGPIDAVRGTITGVASPQSKQ